MPQDLSEFALALFSYLMDIGFECATRLSLANLLFVSFLFLFTFINVEYDFFFIILAGECITIWCKEPIPDCLRKRVGWL